MIFGFASACSTARSLLSFCSDGNHVGCFTAAPSLLTVERRTGYVFFAGSYVCVSADDSGSSSLVAHETATHGYVSTRLGWQRSRDIVTSVVAWRCRAHSRLRSDEHHSVKPDADVWRRIADLWIHDAFAKCCLRSLNPGCCAALRVNAGLPKPHRSFWRWPETASAAIGPYRM